MSETLFYIAGGLLFTWGIAHLFPTKPVVESFGHITVDNQRIITMEWVIEGLTLMFLGSLVVSITIVDASNPISSLVYYFCIAMLGILALVSLMTGFKVNYGVFKLCPVVFGVSATLILIGLLMSG